MNADAARRGAILRRHIRCAKNELSENMKLIAEASRRSSLFALLRETAGNCHAVRLLRLVNASRNVHSLSPIRQRAFVVWLNRLGKVSGRNPSARKLYSGETEK
jgi:hypothetical protein